MNRRNFLLLIFFSPTTYVISIKSQNYRLYKKNNLIWLLELDN